MSFLVLARRLKTYTIVIWKFAVNWANKHTKVTTVPMFSKLPLAFNGDTFDSRERDAPLIALRATKVIANPIVYYSRGR